MSGGFFRGTSAEQDTRFSNKQAKLIRTMKFPPELEEVVDMSKVKMEVMKPWINRRVTELLGIEDDVVLGYIHELLVGKVDGKKVQIAITGFMEKHTGRFMKELWGLLTSAQGNVSGIPQQFLDEKAEELRIKKEEEERIMAELRRLQELQMAEAEAERQRKATAAAAERSAARNAAAAANTAAGETRQLDDKEDASDTSGDGGRRSRRSDSPLPPPPPPRRGRSGSPPLHRRREVRDRDRDFHIDRHRWDRRDRRSPPPMRRRPPSEERDLRPGRYGGGPRRGRSPPMLERERERERGRARDVDQEREHERNHRMSEARRAGNDISSRRTSPPPRQETPPPASPVPPRGHHVRDSSEDEEDGPRRPAHHSPSPLARPLPSHRRLAKEPASLKDEKEELDHAPRSPPPPRLRRDRDTSADGGGRLVTTVGNGAFPPGPRARASKPKEEEREEEEEKDNQRSKFMAASLPPKSGQKEQADSGCVDRALGKVDAMVRPAPAVKEEEGEEEEEEDRKDRDGESEDDEGEDALEGSEAAGAGAGADGESREAKRKRKEEKRARREEKHRRKEEKRRRKEEKRARKVAKLEDTGGPTSLLPLAEDGGYKEGYEGEPARVRRKVADGGAEQRQLEEDLRQKALRSLLAKKSDAGAE
eukprot:SM000036S13268  [mRNA]  locus=s36:193128:195696:- [translate_table: standard]